MDTKLIWYIFQLNNEGVLSDEQREKIVKGIVNITSYYESTPKYISGEEQKNIDDFFCMLNPLDVAASAHELERIKYYDKFGGIRPEARSLNQIWFGEDENGLKVAFEITKDGN